MYGFGPGSIPTGQDYLGAARKQAQAGQQATDAQTQSNRLNQFNPYGSLTYGPDGSQRFQFTGPMGELNARLQQQALQAMGTPFSLSGLPGLTDGATARQQAIDAAYGDATKRMDPQWQQREEQTRTRLLQQGLAEGSQAYNDAMRSLSGERNDAYASAMNSAIGQGTAAGGALYNQSMMTRQNALAEMLRQRGQAMGELQGMNSLSNFAGYNAAGRAEAPQYLQAAMAQGNQDFRNWEAEQQQWGDLFGGVTQLGGKLLPLALSDVRAKQDVVRLPVEAAPGVPLAVWRYRPEYGDASALYLGVLAQDVARAAPAHASRRPDGLLLVSSLFAPVRLA